MNEPAKKPGPAPESYSPKHKPEIMRLAEQAQGEQAQSATTPAVKTAPATIPAKARNQVRIIELPACKMVTSGVCPSEECEQMQRFCAWWPAQDELRKDRFYGRDFLMWDFEEKGFAWGLALSEASADTGGWEVIDFPGGLFAMVNYNCVEGERGAIDAYYGIKKWVEKSGCFAMDEDAGRHDMWHGLCPKAAWDAMGYMQFDMYVPIRIKEE